MRLILSALIALLLAACVTTHGPQSIILSASDIEQAVQADLGGVMEVFKGLELRRPDVSLMPASERLLLAWHAKLPDGPGGAPLGVTVEISGKPALNAALTGIDLTQVRIEDVRLSGLPRFLGLASVIDRKGTTLPDLPLMTLPADKLRQADIAYGATGVDVTFGGLRIDIAPK